MVSYGCFEQGDESFLVGLVVDEIDKLLRGRHCSRRKDDGKGWALSITKKGVDDNVQRLAGW